MPTRSSSAKSVLKRPTLTFDADDLMVVLMMLMMEVMMMCHDGGDGGSGGGGEDEDGGDGPDNSNHLVLPGLPSKFHWVNDHLGVAKTIIIQYYQSWW